MAGTLRAPEQPGPEYRARLFETGGSQAVRLPKQGRLPGSEVLVRRMGASVILSPMPKVHSDAVRALLLGPPRRLLTRPPQVRLERGRLDL